mgnify:CR=1 FL=1
MAMNDTLNLRQLLTPANLRPLAAPILIIIILSISVPITTVLLARAAVFRHRQAGDPRLPKPLLRARQQQQK